MVHSKFYKSLKITGDDFTLSDNNSNVTLGKLQLGTRQRYQPRQRYALNVANNTQTSDIVVSVDNLVVASNKYVFDAGDRWQITAPSTVSGNSSISYVLNTGVVNANTSFHSNNITEYDGNYPFVDVYLKPYGEGDTQEDLERFVKQFEKVENAYDLDSIVPNSFQYDSDAREVMPFLTFHPKKFF